MSEDEEIKEKLTIDETVVSVVHKKKPGRTKKFINDDILSNGLSQSQWDKCKIEASMRRPPTGPTQILREAVEFYTDHLARQRSGTASDERNLFIPDMNLTKEQGE